MKANRFIMRTRDSRAPMRSVAVARASTSGLFMKKKEGWIVNSAVGSKGEINTR
jgi:hypothetical protein